MFSFFFNVAQAGVLATAQPLQDVFMKVMNFFLSVFGVLAVISMIVSGIMYLSAGGNERRMESAKSAMKYSITGTFIGAGSYVIIKTIDTLLR